MKKMNLGSGKTLVVDLCPICGGIWFDRGEVQEIRQVEIESIRPLIDLSPGPHVMRCHYCHVLMDRNESKCRICNWQNMIECPVCGEPMKRSSYKELILDVCGRCGGLWFDRNELAEIWNPAQWDDARIQRRNRDPASNPAWSLLDGLFYWPDGSGIGSGSAVEASFAAVDGAGNAVIEAGSTMLDGAAEGVVDVAGQAIGATTEGVAEVAVEAIGEAAEGLAEVAVEAVGEAAGGIAEAILEFIAELIGSALG
jgi:Zn-finger nucleic acid-binding protein